jgi:hypothetical protein
LEPTEVLEVLQRFPGFFRRSKTKDKSNGEYFYTVHLRYARRLQEESSEALSPEELSSLFNLISQMTTHEHEASLLSVELKEGQREVKLTTRMTLIVAVISALASIVAAVIGVILAK